MYLLYIQIAPTKPVNIKQAWDQIKFRILEDMPKFEMMAENILCIFLHLE